MEANLLNNEAMETQKQAHPETGHAPNLDSFRKLKTCVERFGDRYAPNVTALQIPSLNAIGAEVAAAMLALDEANAPYFVVINQREEAFKLIPALASRSLRMAETMPINKTSLERLKELERRLYGRRAKAKAKPQGEGEGAQGAAPHRYISVSQLSFAQRIEHFEEFIVILKNEPSYAPHEEALQVPTLESRLSELALTNDAVMQRELPVREARYLRNKLMYAPQTGMVDIALSVKKYVYAAFGRDSEEYGEVKELKFSRPRI
jgi:hypothetical protein